MARNDVRHAMFQAGAASGGKKPELAYWVRLSTGHFFEAANALGYWRQLPAVSQFLSKLPNDARNDLASVTKSVQELGHGALAHSRNRTFHYPYPTSRYPTDAELEAALGRLGEQEAEWVDEGDGRFRLRFADDVALALALGKHDEARVERQLELARDGSIAFVNFVTRAMEAYLRSRGFSLPAAHAGSDPPTR